MMYFNVYFSNELCNAAFEQSIMNSNAVFLLLNQSLFITMLTYWAHLVMEHIAYLLVTKRTISQRP